jgi:hypothetical protein
MSVSEKELLSVVSTRFAPEGLSAQGGNVAAMTSTILRNQASRSGPGGWTAVLEFDGQAACCALRSICFC